MNRRRLLLSSLTGLIILVVWESMGRLGGIDAFMFSWPSEILGSLLKMADSGLLWKDLRISGIELVLGLALATLGIPVGLLLGHFRWLEDSLDPYISAAYATPTVALPPLFGLWVGRGMLSKVMIIFLMAFFPICINTMAGVKTTEASLLKAARAFGCKGVQLFTEVILPSTLPFVVTGLRLAIGRGLIAVVIGEFLGATAGLGFRIRSMAELFRTPEYLAGVTVIIVLAILLTEMLRMAERRFAPWRHQD